MNLRLKQDWAVFSPSVSSSRTTASPVVFDPGSSLTRMGWVSPPIRSFSRMVNGAIL